MGGLDEMIADLRRLGDGWEPELARQASPLVEAALQRTAAAGQTPEGQAWAPRKAGGRAMAHAAAAITVKAYPTVLRAVLTGVEVFHHYGKGASEVRRRVIPDVGTIPDVVEAALRKGAELALSKLLGLS